VPQLRSEKRGGSVHSFYYLLFFPESGCEKKRGRKKKKKGRKGREKGPLNNYTGKGSVFPSLFPSLFPGGGAPDQPKRGGRKKKKGGRKGERERKRSPHTSRRGGEGEKNPGKRYFPRSFLHFPCRRILMEGRKEEKRGRKEGNRPHVLAIFITGRDLRNQRSSLSPPSPTPTLATGGRKGGKSVHCYSNAWADKEGRVYLSHFFDVRGEKRRRSTR